MRWAGGQDFFGDSPTGRDMSGIPEFRNTRGPILRTPMLRGPIILVCRNPTMRKFQNSGITEPRNSWIPEFRDFEFRDSGVADSEGAIIPKSRNSRIPKFQNSGISTHMLRETQNSSKPPEFRHAQFIEPANPGPRESRNPGCPDSRNHALWNAEDSTISVIRTIGCVMEFWNSGLPDMSSGLSEMTAPALFN